MIARSESRLPLRLHRRRLMFGCRCCCYRHHITSCSPPNAYKPSIILNIKCISDSRIIPNCLLWTIARELEPSEDISTNVCVYNTTQYKIECWNNFIKWNQKQWVSVRTRVPGPPTTDISNATNVTIKEVIKENMYAQAYITSFVEWESERERKKKTHVNCRGHSPYPISIWIKYNIGNCCNCFSHMRIRTHYNANIYIGPGRPFGRSVRLYADYKMYKHVLRSQRKEKTVIYFKRQLADRGLIEKLSSHVQRCS